MRIGRSNSSRSGLPLVVVTLAACEAPQAVAPPRLAALLPGFRYPAWFTDVTGLDTDPVNFGAYVMEPVGETLYVGFGANGPAASDGALLAAFDHEGWRDIASLSEQGMLDFATAGDTLLFPGVDPCCGEGWEFGNFYTYHPAKGLIKWRNLPNVIHGWGTWFDPGDGAVYLAASAHLGDFETWTGEVWRTRDTGATWELVADRSDSVGDFRTYDVIGQHHRLYAVRADTLRNCELVVQPSDAHEWKNVLPERHVACGLRLVDFGDRLVAIDSSRDALYVVSAPEDAAIAALPFVVGSWSFNWATVAAQRLYVVTDDGRIVTTRDLANWETVAASDVEFLSIRYWPSADQLVVASRGTGASIWTLQLCGGAPC